MKPNPRIRVEDRPSDRGRDLVRESGERGFCLVNSNTFETLQTIAPTFREPSMPWYDFYWTPEVLAKIDEHGVSQHDVEYVIEHAEDREISRSTDRLIAKGYSLTGQYIVAAYEMIDEVTIFPITAYSPEDYS